tara:strand:- start:37 stop:630 length:594 start_codon:yes stop_codon:yes gene_type:complete
MKIFPIQPHKQRTIEKILNLYKLFASIKIKMIKKNLFFCILFVGILPAISFSAEPKSLGKYKNWEAFTFDEGSGKVCFAQTIPTQRSPKTFKREESRFFVTFRKKEKIKNEISITSGHFYKKSSVIAKSGKNEFLFFSQGKFAWISDGEEEFNLIKVMKKATKLTVSASDVGGNKTRDLYSMMGFTKAYNTAKKSCA